MKRAAQDSDNEDRLSRRAKIDDTNTEGNGGKGVDTAPIAVKPTEKKEADDAIVDADTPTEDEKPKVKEAPAEEKVTASTSDTAAAKSQPHRKPKNFAERLMRTLQNDAGKDAIWWMPDGKAIAIHTRNLRDSEDLLMENFKVRDYSVFIRNCNRWGFRRTVQYQVEQGVITYECSLFDRESPHLVRHMRMDSDVQDVFVRHRDTEGSDVPFDPRRIGRANYASRGVTASEPETDAAPAQEDSIIGSPQQQAVKMPHNGGVRGMDLQAAAAAAGFGDFATGFGNFMGHHQMTMPPSGLGSHNSSFLRDQYLQLMSHGGGVAGRTVEATGSAAASAADPPGSTDRTAPPASAPLATSAEMKAALTRLLATQTRQTVAPQPISGSGDSQQQSTKPKSILGEGTSVDVLLDLILTLSDEYLNHPNATSSPETESICMAMKLLKIQGEKYKEEKAAVKNQSQAATAAVVSHSSSSDANSNILDSLRSQLNRGSAASSQPHQGMTERLLQAEQLFQTSQLVGTPGLLRFPGEEQDSLADQLRKQQLERMLVTSMSPQAILQLAQSMGIAPAATNNENQASSMHQLMQLLQQQNRSSQDANGAGR